MKKILYFLIGAGVGSVITWKIVEKKYKELADEEIASVVETFKNRKKEKRTKKEIRNMVDNVLNDDDMAKNIITDNEYASSEDGYIDVENGPEIIVPYVITPEEFGENNEYGTKTLTYYADDVLADEIDEPITEDIDIMLGPDALSHFGEYEPDSIYIRDETNEIDYEILKSEKKFSEIPRGRVI